MSTVASDADAPLFSIICVFNRKEVVDQWLQPSLQLQSAAYELNLIDNSGGRFSSAAAALNFGAKSACGQYLLFVHQDVRLPLDQPEWLDRAAELMQRLPDLGVAGIIGSSGDGTSPQRESFNSITQGVPPNVWRVENQSIPQPVPVQTLDELMLIVRREVFARLPFDEVACPGWHLYGVDYALSVRSLGLQAYVLPLTLHHVSPGKVDASYYATLRRVLPKHRETNLWLYTGCGVWNTRWPVAIQKLRHKARSAWRLAKLKVLPPPSPKIRSKSA